MIRYVKGDLFKTEAEIIAHGCNCRGGFGSGIAGIISKLYPQVREIFSHKFNTTGWQLGEIQVVDVGSKIIVNCATQLEYGNGAVNGKVYVNYDAVRSCMEKLLAYKKETGKSLAIPKIGAGLAGGDWQKIESIINDVFKNEEILVYIL